MNNQTENSTESVNITCNLLSLTYLSKGKFEWEKKNKKNGRKKEKISLATSYSRKRFPQLESSVFEEERGESLNYESNSFQQGSYSPYLESNLSISQLERDKSLLESNISSKSENVDRINEKTNKELKFHHQRKTTAMLSKVSPQDSEYNRKTQHRKFHKKQDLTKHSHVVFDPRIKVSEAVKKSNENTGFKNHQRYFTDLNNFEEVKYKRTTSQSSLNENKGLKRTKFEPSQKKIHFNDHFDDLNE